ncbi:MAG: hypothetical protein U0Q12_09130 [Vicinamibacterales bacterium]
MKHGSLLLPSALVGGLCLVSSHNAWLSASLLRPRGTSLWAEDATLALILATGQVLTILTWVVGTGLILASARFLGHDPPSLAWSRVLRTTAVAHAPLLVWAIVGAVWLWSAQHMGPARADVDAEMLRRAQEARAVGWMAESKWAATLLSVAWLVVALKHAVPLPSYRRSLLVVAPLLLVLTVFVLVSIALGGGR